MRREDLRPGVEGESVIAVRAAVDVEDDRVGAVLVEVGRLVDPGVDIPAIPRDGDLLDLRRRGLREEIGVRIEQHGHVAGCAVDADESAAAGRVVLALHDGGARGIDAQAGVGGVPPGDLGHIA